MKRCGRFSGRRTPGTNGSRDEDHLRIAAGTGRPDLQRRVDDLHAVHGALTPRLSAYRGTHEVPRPHGHIRAYELAADGDMEGRAVWLRIVKAVEELLSRERPGDAEVH